MVYYTTPVMFTFFFTYTHHIYALRGLGNTKNIISHIQTSQPKPHTIPMASVQMTGYSLDNRCGNSDERGADAQIPDYFMMYAWKTTYKTITKHMTTEWVSMKD